MQPELRQSAPRFREMPLARVHASPVTELARGPRVRGLAIALVAASFLAWAGAFGTGASPPGLRFFYWLATMAGGTFVGIAVNQTFCRRGWFAGRPWLQGAATAVAMAVPYTGVVWALGMLLEPQPFGPAVIQTFGPVLAISGAMTAVNLMAGGRLVEIQARPTGSAPPRFLERLPPRLRGADLYAVEAQDHYLRLHTSQGTDLILMRLADALAELQGLEGAQIHRSWWVAKAAVDDARRSDGRGVLRLKSGVEAPVSRRFAQALRAEGWF